MYCLHCHEKIPRLRAWRTKSQFCSEECAENYRTQTMERLTEPGEESQPVPPPIHAPDPEDILDGADLTETASAEVPPQTAEEDLITAGEMEIFSDAIEDSGIFSRDRDELWQVAGEVGERDAETGAADTAQTGSAVEQTPEEALAALIAITEETSHRGSESDESEQEFDELELAAESPPEPDFHDGMDLLDEDELERATAPDPAAASILDRLVEESDWSAPAPKPESPLDDQSAHLEAALVESLSESQPQPVEEAPPDTGKEEVPVEADREEASADAAEPLPVPAPEEADFTDSILAAVEQIGEGVAGPSPEADSAVEEEPGDAPQEEERQSAPAPPVAAPNKKSNKAPKLRPATVMAGIYPTPSGGDETAVTKWQDAIEAGRAPHTAQLGANNGADRPLLNGIAAPPISTAGRFHTYCGLKISFDFGFTPPSSDESGAGQAEADLSQPLQPVEAILWPGRESACALGLGFTDRGPVGRPMLSELEATPPEEDPTPPEGASFAAGPLEPAEFIYETVSEPLVEGVADEDGDWFTDIDGFESL